MSVGTQYSPSEYGQPQQPLNFSVPTLGVDSQNNEGFNTIVDPHAGQGGFNQIIVDTEQVRYDSLADRVNTGEAPFWDDEMVFRAHQISEAVVKLREPYGVDESPPYSRDGQTPRGRIAVAMTGLDGFFKAIIGVR